MRSSILLVFARARGAKAPSTRFSITDIGPNKQRCSGTFAIPSSTIRCADRPINSVPLKRMEPILDLIRLATALSSVVQGVRDRTFEVEFPRSGGGEASRYVWLNAPLRLRPIRVSELVWIDILWQHTAFPGGSDDGQGLRGYA